jgi:hypothetical protein
VNKIPLNACEQQNKENDPDEPELEKRYENGYNRNRKDIGYNGPNNIIVVGDRQNFRRIFVTF